MSAASSVGMPVYRGVTHDTPVPPLHIIGKKVVWVTDASHGLGLALATYLAENGYKTYATVPHADRNLSLQKSLNLLGGYLNCVRMDASKAESVSEAVKEILTREVKIDVVVNTPHRVLMGTVESAERKELSDLYAAIYLSSVTIVQVVTPFFKEWGVGQFIHINSAPTGQMVPHMENTKAMMAAVDMLYQSLAVSLSPWHIKVSVFVSGTVNAFANDKKFTGSRKYNGSDAFLAHAAMLMEQEERQAVKPVHVAQAIAGLMEQERPPLFYYFGEAGLIAGNNLIDPSGDPEKQAMIEHYKDKGLLRKWSPQDTANNDNDEDLFDGLFNSVTALTADFIKTFRE